MSKTYEDKIIRRLRQEHEATQRPTSYKSREGRGGYWIYWLIPQKEGEEPTLHEIAVEYINQDRSQSSTNELWGDLLGDTFKADPANALDSHIPFDLSTGYSWIHNEAFREMGTLVMQMHSGGQTSIDAYFDDRLKLVPNELRREALANLLGSSHVVWTLLGRKQQWKPLSPTERYKYLRVAVRREAVRIRRRREKADRVWWSGEKHEQPDTKLEDLAETSQRSLESDPGSDPLETFLRKESRDRIISTPGLKERDRELLRLLLDDASPAQAVASLGRGWSPWISLRAKLRRRRAK